jgi:hypothetical protein
MSEIKPTDFNLELFDDDLVQDFQESQLHAEDADQTTETPLADKNKLLMGNPVNFEKFFNDLLLEVCEVEKGFHSIQEKFTQALLSQGVEMNPQGVYQNMDLILTRMVKILMVKRMASVLGLHQEYDDILAQELNLAYGRPALQKPSAVKSVIAEES